jgi:hypothetical protein
MVFISLKKIYMHQNAIFSKHRNTVLEDAHVAVTLTLIQFNQLLLGFSKFFFRKLRRFGDIPLFKTPFNACLKTFLEDRDKAFFHKKQSSNALKRYVTGQSRDGHGKRSITHELL